jgi:hypothetical protein
MVAVDTSAPTVLSFDGPYRSTIRVTSMAGGDPNATNWCDTPGQSVVTVTDGQLSYPLPHPNVPGNPTPVYLAMMAPDGSFSGQLNEGSMTGQITDGHMQGRIDGSGCVYAFTGDRI